MYNLKKAIELHNYFKQSFHSVSDSIQCSVYYLEFIYVQSITLYQLKIKFN